VAGSSDLESKCFWKEMWALPIPNTEKNFLWRASHDCLPTMGNLWRRKIIADSLCPLCASEEEMAFHALWQCPSAKDVWSMGSVKLQKSVSLGPSFRQVL
jgi:hypothetical protein